MRKFCFLMFCLFWVPCFFVVFFFVGFLVFVFGVCELWVKTKMLQPGSLSPGPRSGPRVFRRLRFRCFTTQGALVFSWAGICFHLLKIGLCCLLGPFLLEAGNCGVLGQAEVQKD